MLYRFFVSLLRPYPILIFLLLFVVVVCWRRKIGPRSIRFAMLIATLLLWFFSMPVVSFFSAATLEWQYPPVYERLPEAEAIVVLGSGVAPPDAIRARAELDQGGLRRCLKAAELYKSGEPCPIVVTGGRVESYKTGPVMAEVMREFLIRQGVSAGDVILENESRSTYENAVKAAALLKQQDIESVLVVSDATHLIRGVGCFRNLGLQAYGGGCGYTATDLNITPRSFLPSAAAAAMNQIVFHEWLGLIYYRLLGRI
tara:strand:- start:92 stop:862 length:771 start_codon:yes stop_codon:yes gene_type:complete